MSIKGSSNEDAARIVLTGMGVVSPLGNCVDTFWRSLCEGGDGISDITVCDLDGFAFARGGQVCEVVLDPAQEAVCGDDRALRMAVAAASQAVGANPPADGGKVAVVLATNFGSAGTLDKDLGTRSKWDKGQLSLHNAAAKVAEIWGFGAMRATVSLSCSSGAAAIAYAAHLIRNGHASQALAGGFDGISRFAWAGLGLLRTMTDDKVRPFDKNRSGTLFSEGAGIVMLESLRSARLRNSQILAEIKGWAFNSNAYHMTAPPDGGQGIAESMRDALGSAGLPPEAVGHVNTHGTATQLNDLTETKAIKQVFGGHASKMLITSIKSMTGHMMGAAGSVEAIATALSIKHGKIPPTRNYLTPDPRLRPPDRGEQMRRTEP